MNRRVLPIVAGYLAGKAEVFHDLDRAIRRGPGPEGVSTRALFGGLVYELLTQNPRR